MGKFLEIIRKQWMLLVGVAVAVAFVVTLLVMQATLSFSSDADMEAYLYKRVSAMKRVDKKFAADMRDRLEEMIAALSDGSSKRGARNLVRFVASCGEKAAVTYLFEEKGFPAELADEAYAQAAGHGHVEVLEYLETRITCKEKVYPRAYGEACMAGKSDVVEYLVEQGGVEPKEEHIVWLLSMKKDFYKEVAIVDGAYSGSRTDVGDLMEDVAEVAGYLIRQGGLDCRSKAVRQALKNCPNPGLRALFE